MNVVPVNTPTLNQSLPVQQNNITGVIRATPGSNGFATLVPDAPATAPDNQTGVTGSNNVGTAAPDPNAAKIAAYLASGQSSQLASGMQEGSAAGANYQGQAGQLYTNIATGQNTIDAARKNIGVNQINSIKDLMSTIKNGLQGVGVQLGNSNALDSSASGAAARAYARYGNVQTNKINNSAATANADQDVQQANLDITKNTGLTGLKAFRDNAISTITTDAQKGLDSLASTIALLGGDASKIDVAGIRQQILQNAQDKLAAVDGYIQSTIGGVHAAGGEQTAHNAYAASNAGVVPSGPGLNFQLDDPNAAPQALLGGADTSLIPLALKPRDATA